MRPDALIFDFDGVLIDSEFEGNRHLAQTLTELGHAVSVEAALVKFSGLSGKAFYDAIEAHIGHPVPDGLHGARAAEDERVLRDGIAEVAGAIAFVRGLPADLPRAVASSSRSDWIVTHLEHLGIRDAFGSMIFSGREHVARGKPAPDIYLHAAAALGVPIERCVILEDSEVGVKGALASGARVIGLAAGAHCLDGHEARLRALGVRHVAHDFDEVRRLIGLA
jgi:beta-phosphoglucomutase-like phosphatase (HAD superfamily)